MKRRLLLVIPVLLLWCGLAGWSVLRLYPASASAPALEIPTTTVHRGDVRFVVYAKGELQGGNTEVLAAPQVGGQALAITFLRENGELVKAGEVVVQFDTTEEEFKLREAEADLAEAEQQLIQARAESRAKEEEARLALIEARGALEVAHLETRRNPVLAAVAARENDLAAAGAAEKVKQLERNLGDRIETAQAGIAIQEAAQEKARVAAATARRNIDAMTLRAKSGGYVARQQNTEGNWRWGTYLPALQVGDTVRAGVPVAQIPDLKNWQATVRIGELDRAHLAVGQTVSVGVVALPDNGFQGKISSIGGTTGPPWDRHFDCRIALDRATTELRPGMSVKAEIMTDLKHNVLWLPSQAVNESDGRKFVYLSAAGGFVPHDVKLVRRSESQAVIEGLSEGQLVALANPDQMRKQPAGRAGAMQAISR